MTTTPAPAAPTASTAPPASAATPPGGAARALWASGDYPRVAAEVIPGLGRVLVEASSVGPGMRVLDVAAGTGNAAVPAAERGADVVASDITPELVEVGRRSAEAAGIPLTWEVADAAQLPHRDTSFDVVMSCVGVMFAPDHAACARELLRVLRPGGTLGLLSWTPEGFIGRLLAALAPYRPAPPLGAQPPVLWGREDHVLGLLGDGVTDVQLRRQHWRVSAFATPADFRERFGAWYGPVLTLRTALAGEPERLAALDADLEALAAEAMAGSSGAAAGAGAMDWEYLLLTARRREA